MKPPRKIEHLMKMKLNQAVADDGKMLSHKVDQKSGAILKNKREIENEKLFNIRSRNRKKKS